MIGIIVQLVISWILVRFIEKKDLGVLGFRLTKQRLLDFGLFFIVTAICASSGFFMRMYFGERWQMNPDFTWTLLIDGIGYNIKSVIYEELIFRGVIFYILIKKLGVINATIISSVTFGIYHWFSFGILGKVEQMIIVFLVSGIVGALFAYGYAKTFSLYIPCAMHLAWNFTRNFIFSDGNIGNGILVMAKAHHTSTVSYFVFYFVIYFPILAMLIVNFLLVNRKKQVEE